MSKQLLHLVIGGKLKDTTSTDFADLDEVDIVGVYPDYHSAEDAWRKRPMAASMTP